MRIPGGFSPQAYAQQAGAHDAGASPRDPAQARRASFRQQIDRSLQSPEGRDQLRMLMREANNDLRNTSQAGQMGRLEQQLARTGTLTPEQRNQAADLFVRAQDARRQPVGWP